MTYGCYAGLGLALTLEGFKDLTKIQRILGNAQLQNRMGLGYCWTFVPSDPDNITNVVKHLNDLLQMQHSWDLPVNSGFNFWAWLMRHGWVSVLKHLGLFCGITLLALLVLVLINI